MSISVGLVLYSFGAAASSYDSCLLKHLNGVTSDIAAVAIKESCLHVNETKLPDSSLSDIKGSAVYETFKTTGQLGLRIMLRNESDYLLTGITIAIQNIGTRSTKEYQIRKFWDYDTFYTSVPDMSLFEMIQPHSNRDFGIEIAEGAKLPVDFFKEYRMSISSATGVPPD